MSINIKIKGLRETNQFLVSLPRNINNAIRKEQLSFLKDVKRDAKLFAPKFSGQLADSITIQKIDKNTYILAVESPYGVFQETGYAPHTITRNMNSRTGYRVSDWMKAKGVKGRYMTVKGFKPFIAPALEKNLSKLAQRLDLVVEKAVKRSKR